MLKSLYIGKKKVKLSQYSPWRPIGLWDVEAPTFSKESAHRWRRGCQPYAPAGRPLPPGRFLVLISVRAWVDPRAIVRMEGLGQLKNPVTSSGIAPATFRLVAQCLGQLLFRVTRYWGSVDFDMSCHVLRCCLATQWYQGLSEGVSFC
jgi:hypothetical protein